MHNSVASQGIMWQFDWNYLIFVNMCFIDRPLVFKLYLQLFKYCRTQLHFFSYKAQISKSLEFNLVYFIFLDDLPYNHKHILKRNFAQGCSVLLPFSPKTTSLCNKRLFERMWTQTAHYYLVTNLIMDNLDIGGIS